MGSGRGTKALSSASSRTFCSVLSPILVGRASHSQIPRASFVPRKQATASLNKTNTKLNIKPLHRKSFI